MRAHCTRYMITILIVLLAVPAFAVDDLVRVEAEGAILLGDELTPAQAKAAALNNARRAALEKATGVEVHGSSMVYNFQLINDLVVTATKGIIVNERILRNSCASKDEQISCTAKIEARVKPLHAERRGGFRISDAGVHRPERQEEVKSPVFQSGDEIHVHATANQDAYLNFFSVDQFGGISKLYPNSHVAGEKVPAGKELVFPDDSVRQSGLKFRVRTPKGRKQAVESVLVIATKERSPLLEKRKEQDLTITDLMQELSNLDPSQWVEKTVGYEVRE